MSYDIVLHYLAALFYLGLGVSIWSALFRHQPLSLSPFLLLITLIIQGGAVYFGLFSSNTGIKLNWTLGLSFTLWLGVFVYWRASHFMNIQGFQLLLFPIATLICALAGWIPTSKASVFIQANSSLFTIHLLTSLFAYSLIALGALQALIMTSLDNYLHRPQYFNQTPKFLSRLLDAQAPLLVQERLLFRLIRLGFILLSISILTGMFVSTQLMGKLLPTDHKTFFSLMSWFIFGILLAGRHLWGWRGRVALRWTLFGFALLMLAYTGTHLIFEELLHKGLA